VNNTYDSSLPRWIQYNCQNTSISSAGKCPMQIPLLVWHDECGKLVASIGFALARRLPSSTSCECHPGTRENRKHCTIGLLSHSHLARGRFARSLSVNYGVSGRAPRTRESNRMPLSDTPSPPFEAVPRQFRTLIGVVTLGLCLCTS
jgi:hypothetical protein